MKPADDEGDFDIGLVDVFASLLTWISIAALGGLLAWGALLLLGWLWG